MPRVQLRFLAALVVLLLVVSPAAIFVKAQGSGTETYAITNARIVTVSGPPIERGAVVIRDGLIVAVGANVKAPADARVIDGSGLTVYPGLIDANTNLGIPEPAPTPAPAGGQAGFLATLLRPPTTSTSNSTQAVGLQPEILVEDLIKPGGDSIEAERSAGITTALTAPRTGIWMGQSALLDLAGETPQQMIVRSPLAMHVGFTPLRGAYPNSLLGVFSVLRQMLLDAQRYREAQRIYEQAPRGQRRPSPDRSLEALLPILDGRLPVVMYADREREIQRALDLAAEFKLKVIIAGGSEAAQLADRLHKENVPVLLSLNFPKRTTAAIPEADPESMRVLRERVAAPKTAGKLATAKVRFAFQSGGLSPISDFVANAAKAVQNGLSKDEALRAFTINAAQIFGVADRLGTIETGKIANLTVMRGDLFDRSSHVAQVFIDGQPIDLKSATPGTSPTGNAANGAWSLNVDLGKGELAVDLTLQQEGERLHGSIQGALGAVEIANASWGPAGEISFSAPVTFEGQTTEANFTGTVTGNEMKGSVNITGRVPGSFTGKRASPAVPQPSPGTSPNEAQK
jgi:imidazolonepropionase-like amidohydrolase